MRSDQILPACHFARVDALEVTADFRARIVEQHHFVEGRLVCERRPLVVACQRRVDSRKRLPQACDYIVAFPCQSHAEIDELSRPDFQPA